MPTDLRAALRDAAEMLESYSEIGFYSDAAKARAKAADLRALADAPPTVAELVISLPAPKTGAPRMAVEWTWPVNGLTFRARRSGSFGLVVERNEGGAVGWRPVKGLCHADLTAPARLVEVSP